LGWSRAVRVGCVRSLEDELPRDAVGLLLAVTVSRVGLEENAVLEDVHQVAVGLVEEILRDREVTRDQLGAAPVVEVLELLLGEVLAQEAFGGIRVVLDVPGLGIDHVLTKVGGPAEPVTGLPVSEAVEGVAELLHGLERLPALKEDLGILRGEVNVRILGMSV
jgi:hypothetical protein